MTDKKTTPSRKKTPARKPKSKSASSVRQQEVHHARIIIICCVAAVIILAALAIFLPRNLASVGEGSIKGVNSDVLQYQAKVEEQCREFGISQYSTLLMALMQQESSGQGTDVFQCSESPFNTQYDNAPGSITDVDYSIRVGVETFAYCLEQAGCKSISDTNALKLALQEYNFGNDYAGWALANYGGYSPENALEFSEKMKAELGWAVYGDPLYVDHVLQYYTI